MRRPARPTAKPGIESCSRRTATTAASSAAVASRGISPNVRAPWSQSRQAAAVTYDLRDAADELWGLGVGCNGLLRVFLQPLLATNDYQPFAAIAERLAGTRAAGVATVIESGAADLAVGATAVVDAAGERVFGASAAGAALLLRRGPCRDAERRGALDGRAGLPGSLCAAAADPEVARARRRASTPYRSSAWRRSSAGS